MGSAEFIELAKGFIAKQEGERDVIYKCFEVMGCFILEKDSKTYSSLKAANKRCDRLNEKSNSGHHFIVLAASGWHEPREAQHDTRTD